MTISSTGQDEHYSCGIHDGPDLRQPWLRQTVLGEFLSLGLIVHASLGGLFWILRSLSLPAGLLLVTGAAWIVIRAAGILSHRTFTPWITVGLIVGTLLMPRFIEIAASHFWGFSPDLFALMLGIVLVADLAECVFSSSGAGMLHRFRRWNWHRIAIWSSVFAFLVYMVLIPVVSLSIEAIQPKQAISKLRDELSLSEEIRLRTMKAMTASIFFALGATIGSFLNVAVFRMPRGESVVFGASRCPRCETQIHGRDNVPILGWLLLSGRCRACQISISSRYPIVETIGAAIFILLYFIELISGGANIPLRRPNVHAGVVWIIFYTKWDLIFLYLFHCFSLSALLTWALVDVDRQRIPLWARWCVCGILLAIPAMAPDLLPVPWSQVSEVVEPVDVNQSVSAVPTSILGGLCGVALGAIAWLAVGFGHRPHRLNTPVERADEQHFAGGHVVSASAIIGLSVGWQAVMGVWLITFALRPVALWVGTYWRFPKPPTTAVLLVAFLVHLACWRGLNTVWWPSFNATLVTWIATCCGLAVLSVANRWVSRYDSAAAT